MKPQKMRRTLLLDIPRNVSRREYALYTLQWGLVFVGIVGAVGMLLSSLRGDAYRTVEALEAIPLWSVADAAVGGETVPMVRLEGVLIASTTATMPDEPELEVLLGAIELAVKTTESGAGSKEAVLHRWEHSPGTLWLSEGGARIRLDVDLDKIPRINTPRSGRPERLYDGSASRLSKTVGYRYLDKDWPLPEAWGPVSSASARVERWYVPSGGRFVVTGRLVPGKDGATLVADDSSGGEIHVLRCPRCGGRRHQIATITDPAVIRRVLAHLHLRSEPPELAPARPPPQLRFARAEPGLARRTAASPRARVTLGV